MIQYSHSNLFPFHHLIFLRYWFNNFFTLDYYLFFRYILWNYILFTFTLILICIYRFTFSYRFNNLYFLIIKTNTINLILPKLQFPSAPSLHNLNQKPIKNLLPKLQILPNFHPDRQLIQRTANKIQINFGRHH